MMIFNDIRETLHVVSNN